MKKASLLRKFIIILLKYIAYKESIPYNEYEVIRMSFSKRMKKARDNKKMTLAQLGKIIDKTEATVQRYESGSIKNLKNDTIVQIANALEVNPAYLMGWIDEPNTSEEENEHTKAIAAHIREDATEEEIKEIQKFIDYTFHNRNQ
ncbi:helix-turn-helix domain-containing protein [Lacicoccus qingdaonensis]|nr:helix-turn-helix transcriptional regulator [Salinicoccus qingdaonensis]